MKALILAPGSRGDVQPYLALGQAMHAAGHTCTLVTTLDHAELVRAHGLSVATIPIDVSAELQRVENQRAVEGGGVVASFRRFAEIARRGATALAEVGLEAAADVDVVVTNFGTTLAADGIARRRRVPVVQAFNVPLTPTTAFPGALFPGMDWGGPVRRLSHRLTRMALWTTARTSAQAACQRVLGTPPAPRLPPGSWAGLLPGPVLYGFSEALLPRPADWPTEAEVTGFWFAETPSDFTPPPALVEFLDRGSPPVCIGFGSMSTESPEAVSTLVLQAAREAGVRVVLLSGWAGLQAGAVSPDVFALPGIPHAWLYPRCAAVVHHGGAGTTAAALRAGVPAVVVPFHGDQPFWASRVHRLGVGPAPIPRRSLTASRLAAALRSAVSDAAVRAKAESVGAAVRAEQGAQHAVRRIVEIAAAGVREA